MKKYIIYTLLFALNTMQALSIAPQTMDRGFKYTLDTSKDVGDIPYETKVTPQGALTYNVPIECYHSPSNFQPNISLAYNSMSGMGIAGMGWSISGLSSISRVNSTVYYDGQVQGANFSDTCAFALDGMRLVKKKGTDYLVTEQGNILVKTYFSIAYTQFHVFFPNGNKAIYKAMYKEGMNEVIDIPNISFAIAEMEDKYGNKITYRYENMGDVPYIKYISYASSRDGNSADISFSYKTIKTGVPFYFDGKAYTQPYLLEQIRVEGYDITENAYSFNLSYKYDETKETYYLEKIKKNSLSENKELNPLVFTYGADKEEKLEVSKRTLVDYPTTSLDSIVSLIPVKFSAKEPTNGLIVMPEKSTYYFGQLSTGPSGFKVPGHSLYYGNDAAYIYKDITNTEAPPVKMLLKDTQAGIFRGLFTIDYDGRGENQILTIKENEKMSIHDRTFHFFELYNSLGIKEDYFEIETSEKLLKPSTENGTDIYASISRIYLISDFLGKGREDLLYITHNKDYNGKKRSSTVVYVDFNEKEVLYNKECFGVDPGDIVSVIDFDGDGRGEICHINEKGCYIYRFDLNTGFNLLTYDSQIKLPENFQGKGFPHIKEGKPLKNVLFGDINGDGKTDILTMSSQFKPIDLLSSDFLGQGLLTIHYSNGRDGFYSQEQTWGESSSFRNKGLVFPSMEDYNKDGKLDLCFYQINLSSGKKKLSTVYISNDGEFSPWPNYPDHNKYFLQDIDGNGLPDLVMLDQEGTVSVYKNIKGKFSTEPIIAPEKVDARSKLVLSRVREANKLYPIMGIKGENLSLISNSVNQQEDRLMSSSINSYGVESKYNYGTLTDKEVCSVQDNNSVAFPYNYILEDVFVLKDIETTLNNTKLSSASYKYHNPVVHRHGLGFRGFEKVSITDNLRDKSTIQKYNPQMFGALTSIQTPTAIVKSDYDTIFAENRRVQLLLKKEVLQDILKSTTTTSNFTYDSYGNLTNRTVDYGDGIKAETSYELSNIDNSTTYLLGLLKEEKQVNIRNGVSSSSKTVIEYNDNYFPDSQKSYYENNQVSEEKYIYDTFNNVVELQTRSYDSPDWLTTKYEYDEQGRKIKETDPLGFSSDYIYDGKNLLQSVKNHKGHTISYKYDRWGRNYQTVYADGTTETTLLSWETSPQSAVFSITTQKSGEPNIKIYFDALGREIRTSSQRFDGSYLYTDNVYDELGRLKKTSLPFKSSPSLWNESTYDSYDRTKSITYASGKKDTYAYNKLKVKSVIDGLESTKVYDASSEVIRVTDASGSITYNLRADGQPESIVAPGDITTSFQYDKYGRQTAIIDPSAGTKKYEYDTYGNINKETDARGKVTKLKYDKFGRLEQKEIISEFSTTYQYNADNLIESEVSTNGTAKNYTYDNLFRLQKEKESVLDGKWLEKTFDYQIDGNIGNITYKSQNGLIATENYEYNNGYNTELKLDNTVSIWKLTGENDLGMPTSSVTGVVDRQYTYDAYGLPTRRILKNGSNTIQDFGYQFEAKTGNLLWRKDNTRNIREDFTYDNLNRLTRFGGTTIQYNNQGNIIDHSAVGYFSYSQTKPYAIDKIEPYSAYLYPEARKQEVTYNALMRPVSISENGYNALFSYNTNGNRVKMNLMCNDTLQLNRYYVGGVYEIDETLAGNTERLYLGGDAYSAAAVYVKEGGRWDLNYIGRDYLGSITHVMDATGVVKQELSYDPWGRLRDPLTQALFELDKRLTLVLGDRGYTGHEHLQEFGLINMNARLYDPVVGRFLSPDPYVQAPDFSQNFNRYSYALNNPLRYTDPNGEFVFVPFLIAAAVGGVINWYAHGAEFSWDGAAYFGIGAGVGIAGMVTGGAAFTALAGAGAAVGTGGALVGAGAGLMGFFGASTVSMLGNNVLMGDPMPTIGEMAMGMGISMATGGLMNGTMAAVKGNNFWNGAPRAFGRSAFAFNNTPRIPTPAKIEPLGLQLTNVQQPGANLPQSLRNPNLSNAKLVQIAGEEATANISGKGAVAGTFKHSYATKLINEYQGAYGDRGLTPNYRFLDNQGKLGILDIMDTRNNVIYDYKWGYPNYTESKFLLTPQMIRYQQRFDGSSIIIIHFK